MLGSPIAADKTAGAATRGYELGSELARVRLVWLLNEPRASDLGVSLGELARDEERWQNLLELLKARALDSFDILDETKSARPSRGKNIERD